MIETDRRLLNWLNVFLSQDSIALCERAYEVRKTSEMKDLAVRAQLEGHEALDSHKTTPFQIVRHFIGRLAHHVRAPKQLISDASQISELRSRFLVRQIPVPICIPTPEIDSLTELHLILKRMMPPNDPSLPSYEIALTDLDRKFDIRKRVLGHYESLQPRIHAEIQVLEYFHKNSLRFSDGDKYIACSKPAVSIFYDDSPPLLHSFELLCRPFRCSCFLRDVYHFREFPKSLPNRLLTTL